MNNDLADIFGNLVNRVLAFLARHYGGIIPGAGVPGTAEAQLALELQQKLDALRGHHEALALRKAADEVRSIWRLGNLYIAEQAPWQAIKDDPDRAAVILRTAANLVAVAAEIAAPFIPDAAARIREALGLAAGKREWPSSAALHARLRGGEKTNVPPELFAKLTPAWVEDRRRQFGVT